MSEAITITPLIQGGPTYELAAPSFVAALEEFEKHIATLSVDSPESQQVAANLQVQITKAGKDLEETRKILLRPAIDWQNLINMKAKEVAGRIDAAKQVLSGQLSVYAEKQAIIARQAEKDRLAELYRLEEIARKEREAREHEEKLAAEANQARLDKLSQEQREREAAEELDFVMPTPPVAPTATERQIEAVKAAPAVIASRPVGVRLTKTLKIKSVDLAKLPEMFITRTAKEDALRKTYCVGWKETDLMPVCPGVEFEIVTTSTSTGRTAF